MKMIKELVDGERIYGQFLVSECNKCVSNKSSAYLNLLLQDASGSMPAKLWEVRDGDLDTFKAGNLVEVEGEVLLYNGSLQMKLLSGKKLNSNPDEVDFSRFVPSSPISQEDLEKSLDSYLSSFKNSDISKLVNHLVSKNRKKYVTWPAAVRNHHNFNSGLLYHTINMAKVADKVCEIYPSLNRDILLGGILIHDIGKTIELSGPIATSFTLEGKLIGHISIMQAEVREACKELNIDPEISANMEHMVLSHHGKQEFGSPVTPVIREALVCSMIDDLDAKMGILDKAFENVEPGESTTKLFNMDDRYFYKPKFDK